MGRAKAARFDERQKEIISEPESPELCTEEHETVSRRVWSFEPESPEL